MGSNIHLNLDSANRILVMGVNWVGDTILTYPTVQKLKTIFPNCHLAILVPSYLVDLWRTFPYVDEIITIEKKHGFRSFFEDLSLSLSLKKKAFDMAVILPRSFHSALLMYLARIPIRIGYEDEGRSLFLTHGIHREQEILHGHRVHYYERIIDPLGRVGATPSPTIFIPEEDRRWAKETLGNLGLLGGEVLIGMNPGATYGLAKCWYPDRFGKLGKRLAERWKATILIFGKKEEGPMATEILGHLGERGVDLTGRTSFLQLAALLEQCRLLVSNDTGTMHVAAAVKTSVVAIFGSTNPLTTGPWGNGHILIRKDVTCSPCLKRVCSTDHRCMELITVEEVEEAANKRLENNTTK